MENKIYVFISKNQATLYFPKCNIKTNAYIGINGVATKKQEGDGKTPLGEFEFGIILGTEPFIKSKLEYKQITENMLWVDDTSSKFYNQLVDIAKVEKDWNSAEHLIDYPIQYKYLVEIKTNPTNIPGAGSAIFLHCTNNEATAGCIAVDTKVMKLIVENIDENTKIEISCNSI